MDRLRDPRAASRATQGTRMAVTSSKTIKEDLARSKACVQRDDALKALRFLCKALEGLLQSQIFGREKFEVSIVIGETLQDVMKLGTFKRLFPSGIAYERGQEKTLYNTLRKLYARLEAAIEKARVERTRKKLEDLDETIIAAQEALKRNEPLEARKLFRKAAEENPEQPGLLSDIGSRLVMAGMLQESLEYLKRAAEVDPNDGRAVSFLIMAYEGMAELDKAEEIVRDTLRRAGGNETLQLKLAKFCLQKREWNEAYNLAKAILAANPANAEAAKIVKQIEPKIFQSGKVPGGGAGPAGGPIKLEL